MIQNNYSQYPQMNNNIIMSQDSMSSNQQQVKQIQMSMDYQMNKQMASIENIKGISDTLKLVADNMNPNGSDFTTVVVNTAR